MNDCYSQFPAMNNGDSLLAACRHVYDRENDGYWRASARSDGCVWNLHRISIKCRINSREFSKIMRSYSPGNIHNRPTYRSISEIMDLQLTNQSAVFVTAIF